MTVLYTAKPGQGCTITAIGLALATHGRVAGLNTGDLAAACGLPTPDPAEPRTVLGGFGALAVIIRPDDDDYADTNLVIDAGGDLAAVTQRAWRHRRVLVTTACYMALQRAKRDDVPAPDAVILLREGGRVLNEQVEDVIGAPVVATIDRNPDVARAVDAGLLVSRAPRSLVGPLRDLRIPSVSVARLPEPCGGMDS